MNEDITSIIRSCRLAFSKGPVVGVYHMVFVIGCLTGLISALIIAVVFVFRSMFGNRDTAEKEYRKMFKRLIICMLLLTVALGISGLALQLTGMM